MNNDYNITAEDYIALYDKYLKRSPDELLLAAGSIKGKHVLDLCAGIMRASNRAKELGAHKVVALDRSKSIIPANHKADKVAICDINNKHEIMEHFLCGSFDLIVCQQGINYWFGWSNIDTIYSLLKKEGHFVFNTFNRKPSEQPTIKEYGSSLFKPQFTEAVQLVGDMVYHLQMRNGVQPHYTSFKWIPPDDFENVLNTYFEDVKSIVDGTTTIYVCKK